jgi:selenocysteine-specific elongation factor
LAVIKDDRYIIRSTNETLGGGGIVDARAKNLRRFRPEIIENLKAREGGTTEEILIALLETRQPLEMAALATQTNLAPEAVETAAESLVAERKIVALGEGAQSLLFTAAGWSRLADKVTATISEYHRRYPVRKGIPRIELSGQLKLGSQATAVVARLAGEGVVVEEGGYLRLPSHNVRLTPAQQSKVDAFLRSLAGNPYSPPSDLIPEPDLLNMLVERGKVVKVNDSVVFATAAYREMLAQITDRIRTNGKVGLGEVRDMFGTSRKYAQALLEYFDREKITRRVGDDRVLY